MRSIHKNRVGSYFIKVILAEFWVSIKILKQPSLQSRFFRLPVLTLKLSVKNTKTTVRVFFILSLCLFVTFLSSAKCCLATRRKNVTIKSCNTFVIPKKNLNFFGLLSLKFYMGKIWSETHTLSMHFHALDKIFPKSEIAQSSDFLKIKFWAMEPLSVLKTRNLQRFYK